MAPTSGIRAMLSRTTPFTAPPETWAAAKRAMSGSSRMGEIRTAPAGRDAIQNTRRNGLGERLGPDSAVVRQRLAPGGTPPQFVASTHRTAFMKLSLLCFAF